MNKAFIFDLDGVIIDNEAIWEEAKREIFTKVLGEEIYVKLGSTLGLSLDGIYERTVKCGSTVPKE
jgi:beta-phosphoglucomutase-like phosphatase (HAD superfamily)